MFELDAAALRRLIFALEDRTRHYAVRLSDGEVVPVERLDRDLAARLHTAPLDPRQPYVTLPDWTSTQGFAVMEAFAEQQNAAARTALSQALHTGPRAFRAFKNSTKQLGLEQRFHRYKTRRLRTVLRAWHAELCELAGLDATELGADEELDGLTEEDILVVPMECVPTALIGELDLQAHREAYHQLDPALSRYLYRCRRMQTPSPADPRSSVWAAETPEHDLVGFLWYFSDPLDHDDRIVWIEQLYVLQSYRRLGVAEVLVRHALQPLLGRPGIHVACNVPTAPDGIREVFARYGLGALQTVLYRGPQTPVKA